MPEVDEDILQGLMRQATDGLLASPTAAAEAIRQRRRRAVRTWALSAAGTAAAAGLAAGVLVATSAPGSARPASGGAASLASGTAAPASPGQVTLLALSTAAAAAPQHSEPYVELTEKTVTSEGYGSQTETAEKATVINTGNGASVTYQDIAVLNPDGTPAPPPVLRGGPGSVESRAALDAMPTDVAALRALLLSQAQEEQNQAIKEETQNAERMHPGAKPQFAYKQVAGASDSMIFAQASDLLWVPDLSPQLRSALYKVLATTPGVTVRDRVRDGAGRVAVEISRVDVATNYTIETFEDPATGATLESLSVGSGGFIAEDLYQSISYTNTIPPDPYQG